MRLRGAYLVTCMGFTKDPVSGEVTELQCTYDPATHAGDAPGRKVKATLLGEDRGEDEASRDSGPGTRVCDAAMPVRCAFHEGACAVFMRAPVLALLLSAACGDVAAKSACDGLVYKEFGLKRAEYLPCAGEMIAALDRLAPQIEAMISGDRNARSDAQATLRDLRTLLKKAGWRDMLERWNDGALTSLNIDIWNAFNHHEACLMVAGGLFGRRPPSDEHRGAIMSECRAYRRPYRAASDEYRRLR